MHLIRVFGLVWGLFGGLRGIGCFVGFWWFSLGGFVLVLAFWVVVWDFLLVFCLFGFGVFCLFVLCGFFVLFFVLENKIPL